MSFALRGAPEPQSSNRYLTPGESLTVDLAALGVALPRDVEAWLNAALGRLDRVTAAKQSRLSEIFDPAFLTG